MNDNVSWILEADINPGHLENLRALIGEMVAGTRNDEPGALDYEWFISDDGTFLHIYERYADSAAVMIHRQNFAQKYAERFRTYLTVTKMTMYGDPSAEVRAGFAPNDPLYLPLADGFAR